jgi:hypothetical protein
MFEVILTLLRSLFSGFQNHSQLALENVRLKLRFKVGEASLCFLRMASSASSNAARHPKLWRDGCALHRQNRHAHA